MERKGGGKSMLLIQQNSSLITVPQFCGKGFKFQGFRAGGCLVTLKLNILKKASLPYFSWLLVQQCKELKKNVINIILYSI